MTVPPRRVLAVNRVGHLGGVERVVLTLADGLRALGWDTVLACPDEGDLPEAARAQNTVVAPCPFDRMRITADLRVLARYPFAWLRGSRVLERHCSEYRVHLVHAHHPVSAMYAMRACRRGRLPLVLHVHETLPAKPLYALAMRLVLPRTSLVLCVSGAAAELARSLGADPARTHVVYNGIDQRFLQPGLPPAPELVHAAGPGPHVGLFGVLEPRKAQHVLLDAAATLAERFPNARYWLIGPAALKDKRAYAERLRRCCEEPELRGRVFLTGFQPEVASWIGAMDVVVQTSTAYESFGMSLAEAAALGRPVVASRVGGMPEVVRDGETGIIVPPSDHAALAEVLALLFSRPDLRADLGRRGATDARERFAPEVFRGAVAAAYAAACMEAS